MKTKQVIYLGFAILLSGASLTNLPTRVSAAESSRSSTSVSSSAMNQDSVSVESGNSESEKVVSSESKAEVSATQSSQKTTTDTISKVRAIKSEPTGTPGSAQTPSKDGWSFLLTIFRKGFSVQPQLEQYVVAKDTENPAKFTGMKMLTGLLTLSKKTNVTRWHWDSASATWVLDANVKDKIDSNGLLGVLGFLNIDDYVPSNLAVGEYYYQFDFDDGIWPLQSHYYSKLARVSVSEQPVPATAIDTTANLPKVVYSDVDYAASALITPSNSTDKITWKASSDSDKLAFTPDNGRQSMLTAGNGYVNSDNKYVEDTYYVNQVNKDPNVFGIPANFAISAGTALSTTKNIAVGGLPAFNKAADVGGSWSVGGLSELVSATGATKPWHYVWKFTDGDGNAIATPTAAEGVTNTEQDITDLTQLNSEQPLTFAKDSSFMKKAAEATASGKSYQAQLTLITSIEPEESSTKAAQKVTVVSNKAELQATPATGKLSLDAVPSFNFGTITASKIYNGTLDPDTAPNAGAGDTLSITDTRVPASGVTNDWTLKATASKFTSGTGSAAKTLNPVTLQLSNILGIPGSRDLTETENTIATKDGSATAGGTNPSSLVKASLLMSPNSTIQLTDGDAFSSQITWNLTTNQPTALAVK